MWRHKILIDWLTSMHSRKTRRNMFTVTWADAHGHANTQGTLNHALSGKCKVLLYPHRFLQVLEDLHSARQTFLHRMGHLCQLVKRRAFGAEDQWNMRNSVTLNVILRFHCDMGMARGTGCFLWVTPRNSRSTDRDALPSCLLSRKLLKS